MKLLTKIIFIIVAFLIILQKIDINTLKTIKIHSFFYLFLALIFFNLSQIISAIRVHYYLKDIKVIPSFKKQLMLYYVGMFYNILLPGGIGGDAYKAYKFQKKFNKGYKAIIKALLIDRISGLFGIFVLIGVLLLFTKYKLFSLIFLISPAILYLLHKFLFKEFNFKTFFYSIIIQSLQALSFLFILFSLGVKKKIVLSLIIFFISSILSTIPISIGGVGIRELTFLYLGEYFHLNATILIICAFLFFMITLISSIIGIIFIKKVKDV